MSVQPSFSTRTDFINAHQRHALPKTFPPTTQELPIIIEALNRKYKISIVLSGHLPASICPSPLRGYQLADEVRLIQAYLKKGNGPQWMGLIALDPIQTNYDYWDLTRTWKHVECLLVSSDQVINPIVWPEVAQARSVERLNINPSSDESRITARALSETFECNNANYQLPGKKVCLQSDGENCGTLCLKILKTLLKNSAQALNSSFLFPTTPQAHQPRYIFFPFPSCLKYSQSGLYNKICNALIMGNTPDKLNHNSHFIHYEPLICRLEKLFPNDLAMQEQWKNKLMTFREVWKPAYEEMENRRNRMQQGEKNLGLAYAQSQFYTFVTARIQETNAITSTEQQHRNELIKEEVDALCLIASPSVESYFRERIEKEERAYCALFLQPERNLLLATYRKEREGHRAPA